MHMHDVHIWGDSHWRNFFPFVNHGSPGVTHEQDGVRTVDMCANELSGATMWGLLNDGSKNGARRRVLGDIDRLGGVDNVGLVFGEVDARYHNERYFVRGHLSRSRMFELLTRYTRFIDDDLLGSGRVRKHIFVYHGFTYPKKGETLLQPGQPMGDDAYERADEVNYCISSWLSTFLARGNVSTISRTHLSSENVSSDGVHLIPEKIYPEILHNMSNTLRTR